MLLGLDKQIYWGFGGANLQVIDCGNLGVMISFEKKREQRQPTEAGPLWG